MKKTYLTPALLGSGAVVRETLSGSTPFANESLNPARKQSGTSSAVGFYL